MKVLAASIKGNEKDIGKIVSELKRGFNIFASKTEFVQGFDTAKQDGFTKSGHIGNTTAEILKKMAFRMNISSESLTKDQYLLVSEIHHYGMPEGADEYTEKLKEMYEKLGFEVTFYDPPIPYVKPEDVEPIE